MKRYASPAVRRKTKEKKNQRSYLDLLFPFDGVEYGDKSYSVGSVKSAARKISVPLKGVLRKTQDDFVYVDVSNDVIHGLFRLIDEDGIEKPPYMTPDFNDVGAHISVMGSSEFPKDKEITELGKEISFKLGKLYSVDPEGWDEMERVWFVEVESSELESLRQKYGLTKKRNGHEFHITVAIRKAK